MLILPAYTVKRIVELVIGIVIYYSDGSGCCLLVHLYLRMTENGVARSVTVHNSH